MAATIRQWPLVSLAICALAVLVTASDHYASSKSSSPSINDFPFHSSAVLSSDGYLLDSYLSMTDNDSCSEIWCDSADPHYYDEEEYSEDGEHQGTRGFWLEPPPDDILYMPPPPMPPAFQASLLNMENGSLKEFIISEDPEEGFRCNFCKIFADPLMPEDPTIYAEHAKGDESFVGSFYVFIIAGIIVAVICFIGLVKYKKWRIFPVSESCPILAGSVLGHHKSPSGSSSSPSDTRLPVVNEKSPQSIIMDAPLASLGKKSTISTTGKYWKRMPANGSGGGNIFSMEDRRGLRSLGGSSTGMSDHPYSDAASCTSSPVYAELDPSVAGSCHTPTLIGPPGTGGGSVVSSFSPYAFSASNTYSEVPDTLRGHLGHHHLGGHHQGLSPSPLLTDSSTYDNAAYLPAASQPFLAGPNHYSTRSLRRLAAQRSAVLNASTGGQVSTPLLAGHPYHVQPYAGTLHHHHLQSTPIGSGGNGQFHFLTGGRPLKKPRPGPASQAHHSQQTSFGYRTGPRHQPVNMNHYVTGDQEIMLADDQQQLTSPPTSYSGGGGPFTFLDNSSSNGSNRKSSSSSQYTEMPLLHNTASSSFNTTGGGPSTAYRMSETCSANDLNSAASSSSAGSAGGNHVTNSTSSANSATSLKRPLPPVPGVGHVRL